MNVLGIIVEYNPFHNGHLYHIKQSLCSVKNTKKLVVVMRETNQRRLTWQLWTNIFGQN